MDKADIELIKKANIHIEKALEKIELDPNIKTNGKRPAQYPMKCDICSSERKFAFMLFDYYSKKFKCFKCFVNEVE